MALAFAACLPWTEGTGTQQQADSYGSRSHVPGLVDGLLRRSNLPRHLGFITDAISLLETCHSSSFS